MTRFLLTASLIVVLTVPCRADEAENIAVVRNLISAVNARKLDGLDNYVAANIVRHSEATPGRQSNLLHWSSSCFFQLMRLPRIDHR